MRGDVFGAFIGLLTGLACARQTSLAVDEQPTAVVIHSGQYAWGMNVDEQLMIAHSARGWAEGNRPIADGLVQALLDALNAPIEPKLNPERIRPLVTNTDAPALRLVPGAPQTAKHIVALLDVPKTFGEILRLAYASRVSDDYPVLSAEVSWSSGRRVKIESASQHPLMLPWSVNDSRPTWNPAISVALAALLPDDFRNRGRAAGTDLTESVVWAARALRRTEFEAEEAEERYGPQLAPLAARFRIEGSTLNAGATINIDGRDIWCGEVYSRAVDQVGFDLCLTAKKQLTSVQPFLHDADALLARVHGLPWLQRYEAAEPKAQISIFYFNTRSLGEKALAVIHYALEKAGKSALDKQLRSQLPSSIGLHLLGATRSRTWIILPDQRSLLLEDWAFRNTPALSVGSMIDPEGEPISTPERSRAQ